MTDTEAVKGSKEKDVLALKDWLDKQPHLPKEIDPELLTAFVYGTKSLEIAKKKLDCFCSLRTSHPNIFRFSPTNEDFIKRTANCKLYYLPKATPEGYRVLCSTHEMVNDQFSVDLFLVRLAMMMELGLKLWPEMAGFVIIYDWKDVPLSYLSQASISAAAGFMKYFQDGYPFKFKKGISFNIPPYIDAIINVLIKPFMKKKLFERITFHNGDGSILKDHFDADMVPSDYGGNGSSVSSLGKTWAQIMEDHQEYFMKTSLLQSDESKRPPDILDTYGIQGTFRSLAVD